MLLNEISNDYGQRYYEFKEKILWAKSMCACNCSALALDPILAGRTKGYCWNQL